MNHAHPEACVFEQDVFVEKGQGSGQEIAFAKAHPLELRSQRQGTELEFAPRQLGLTSSIHDGGPIGLARGPMIDGLMDQVPAVVFKLLECDLRNCRRHDG